MAHDDMPDGEPFYGEIDFDYPLVAELAALLDAKLDDMLTQAEGREEDADAAGEWDYYEHAVGLGFVLLQQYVTSIIGPSAKSTLRRLGQEPVADVVHHAANFWKHRGEWCHVIENGRLRFDVLADAKHAKKRKETIDALLKDAGVDVHAEDYPLSSVLQCIAGPASGRFGRVVSQLALWRVDVRRAQKADGDAKP